MVSFPSLMMGRTFRGVPVGVDEEEGDCEEEPVEVGDEEGFVDEVYGACGGCVEAEAAGEDAGVGEEDAAEGEGPAGSWEGDVAEGPEDGDEEEGGGVEALVDGQQADDEESGEG